MDFDFSTEQQQTADTLRRWIERDYTFAARRRIMQSAPGHSAPAWRALAELGMTALPVPSACGGFDGDAVDLYPVMQELGRGLVLEPYFATAWGTYFLKLAGNQYHWLEEVAAGRARLACALGEKHTRYDFTDIKTLAAVHGEAYRLHGTKTAVLHGAQAHALIVSARSAGSQRDPQGISLFVVPTDTPGVTVQDYRTLDGQRAATVQFHHVAVPATALLGKLGGAADLLDEAVDYGASLLCAEAMGAMGALFSATLAHVKTRKQFGVAIGSFQALQHRMADMYIHLEQARSLALLAAARMGCGDAAERRRIVSAAKVRVNQAATFIGQQAVQLHGGMGVTDELPAAHHFKRLTIIALTLGDVDHHLERFVAQRAFAQPG